MREIMAWQDREWLVGYSSSTFWAEARLRPKNNELERVVDEYAVIRPEFPKGEGLRFLFRRGFQKIEVQSLAQASDRWSA